MLEADGLLNVEPFEAAILGVGFELGECGRRTIDGVLTKPPGLLQVGEVVDTDRSMVALAILASLSDSAKYSASADVRCDR